MKDTGEKDLYLFFKPGAGVEGFAVVSNFKMQGGMAGEA
jgi:hypothetical protein